MAKAKYVIHVNRQNLAMNAKDGADRPGITIKHRGKVRYGRAVTIHGPSKIVGNKDQLACGARVWIETDSEIDITDECSFKESRDIKQLT